MAAAYGLRRQDRATLAAGTSGTTDHVSGICIDGLEQLYGDQHVIRAAFGRAVATAIDLPRHGIAPVLLAALPSAGAITPNQDLLFENGLLRCATPGTVMPESIPAVGNYWLLKLYGSVSAPKSIVLTRDDYLGYNSNREALSGLVKAHHATDNHSYLLAPAYDQGLTDDELDLRRQLLALAGQKWRPERRN